MSENMIRYIPRNEYVFVIEKIPGHFDPDNGGNYYGGTITNEKCNDGGTLYYGTMFKITDIVNMFDENDHKSTYECSSITNYFKTFLGLCDHVSKYSIGDIIYSYSMTHNEIDKTMVHGIPYVMTLDIARSDTHFYYDLDDKIHNIYIKKYKYTGNYIKYNEKNSQKISVYPYINGILHGIVCHRISSYDETKEYNFFDVKTTYENDMKNGLEIQYYGNTKNIHAKSLYINNKLNGEYITYDEYGNILFQGTYDDDHLVGISKVWYNISKISDGRHVLQSITEHDQYGHDVKYTTYYKNGKIEMECTYLYNGKRCCKYYDVCDGTETTKYVHDNI